MFNFREYLCRHLVDIQSQPWADSTMHTRRCHWKKYIDFCNSIETVAIPVDVDSIPIFLLHLTLKGLAFASINNELSAIEILSKLHGGGMDIRGDFGSK